MNRLQERRMELGLSQPEVSERLKKIDPRMDVSMVSRFERGACLPTLSVLKELESILQAHRTELFGADDMLAMSEYAGEEKRPASPVTDTLAKLIPFGRRNAISRGALAGKLGMTDRQMRKAVEEARKDGLIILCECNGRGYWQSNDLVEMQQQYRQDTNRALSILDRRKPLRDALLEAGMPV